MQPQHKPAVMHILRNTPEFLPHEIVIAEELIDAYLENPRSSGYHIMVAETNGQVTGYVCYGPAPLTENTWDIYWIAVDRNRQGEGIGAALMQDTESKIKAMAGRLIVVETSSKPNYNKTRQFYLNRGYTETARIPDFYAIGDDEVIFTRRLSQDRQNPA